MEDEDSRRCYNWPNTDVLTKMESISLATIFGISGLVAFIGNGIILACIIKYKRLQTTPNLLLANLIVADFMVGITTPLNIMVYAKGSQLSCIVQYACGFQTCFFCMSSITLLVVISIERYAHIVKYRTYNAIFTSKRIFLMASMAWCLAAITYVIYILAQTIHFHVILLSFTSFCLNVIGFCYWKIFQKVKESANAITEYKMSPTTLDETKEAGLSQDISSMRTEAQLNAETFITETLRSEVAEGAPAKPRVTFQNIQGKNGILRANKISSTSFDPKARPRKIRVKSFFKRKPKRSFQLRKEYELAKTMAIIIFSVSFCWSPFMTLSFVRSVDIHNNGNRDSFASLYHWLLLLGFVNSAVNPFIYSWRNGQIRNALKHFLGCFGAQGTLPSTSAKMGL